LGASAGCSIRRTTGTPRRACLEDITPSYEARQAIEHAHQQAEEANRAKSSFLANMSHEIRTPMNAIMGMSYLVQKTKLSERQRGYLNKIQSSSQHLLGIINDILDYSKIEAGELGITSTSNSSWTKCWTTWLDWSATRPLPRGWSWYLMWTSKYPCSWWVTVAPGADSGELRQQRREVHGAGRDRYTSAGAGRKRLACDAALCGA